MDTPSTQPRVYRPSVDGDRSYDDARDTADDRYDTDEGKPAPVPANGRKRNRLVILVGVLLGLVGLTVVGWFAGLLLGSILGTDDPNTLGNGDPTTSATASAAPSSGGATAAATPIAVTAATLFDPPPGDGAENPARIDLAHDGNPGTFWPTLQYSGSAAFGKIKPGVGIVFDLGSEQTVGSVKVTTSLPGSTAEIRVGPADAEELAQFTVVSPAQTLSGETTFPVTAGTKAQYVLVWITQLVPVDGKFQANLAEVTFTT